MSKQGLTLDQVTSIIHQCEQDHWKPATEQNQYVFKKFVKGNNNIIIYITKGRGFTIRCNTEILLQHVLNGTLGREKYCKFIIEIDDAGWGSAIGGVGIGFHIPHIHCFDFVVVEPKYFQSPLFEGKDYLSRVTELIQQKLNLYGVDHEWLIKICTGYIFAHARKSLFEQFAVAPTEIHDPLQSYAEDQFKKYLVEQCEVPIELIKNTTKSKEEYRLVFNKIITYLKTHPELRKYCKTGWNFFKERFNT
jgi:hypothetical protein